ncbi:hypothetical protein J6590_067174 [Homalodisca vitripennis]|nr:hypothetical protein J6590_067174 [Homalodisca vitripennis]
MVLRIFQYNRSSGMSLCTLAAQEWWLTRHGEVAGSGLYVNCAQCAASGVLAVTSHFVLVSALVHICSDINYTSALLHCQTLPSLSVHSQIRNDQEWWVTRHGEVAGSGLYVSCAQCAASGVLAVTSHFVLVSALVHICSDITHFRTASFQEWWVTRHGEVAGSGLYVNCAQCAASGVLAVTSHFVLVSALVHICSDISCASALLSS